MVLEMSLTIQGSMMERKIADFDGCHDWKEIFAVLPKITITGKKVWFTSCYKRRVMIVLEKPYDVQVVNEYATSLDLLSCSS